MDKLRVEAEKAAEKIVGQHYVLNAVVSRPTMVDVIAAALESFAREAVEEASLRCDHAGPCDECIEKFRQQGRAEALEQAASYVENRRRENVGAITTYFAEDKILAAEIRALKEISK